MAMNMGRAFNAKMMTRLTKYSVGTGYYDDNNDWVSGDITSGTVFGVLKTGNKFSQMDEGEALQSEDGGTRYSDYKTLYVREQYEILMTDKIEFKGKYYNVLQRSDESLFGFYAVLLEKSKEWTP